MEKSKFRKFVVFLFYLFIFFFCKKWRMDININNTNMGDIISCMVYVILIFICMNVRIWLPRIQRKSLDLCLVLFCLFVCLLSQNTTKKTFWENIKRDLKTKKKQQRFLKNKTLCVGWFVEWDGDESSLINLSNSSKNSPPPGLSSWSSWFPPPNILPHI